jgi:hypothetical protein
MNYSIKEASQNSKISLNQAVTEIDIDLMTARVIFLSIPAFLLQTTKE